MNQVETGAADHASGVAAAPDLARRYGPDSPAARRGRQRFFAAPILSLDFIHLNARRPLFASARMRRAVSFAVDRPALATVPDNPSPGQPTDQFIPPGMPGFVDARVYPVDGPDVATARRLAGPGRRRAVLFTLPDPMFHEQAAILRRNLDAIGIDLHVRELAPQEYEPMILGGHWGLLLFNRWFDDYVDPSEYLNLLFEPGDKDQLGIVTPPDMARRLHAAAQFDPGPARWRAYARLDASLARDQAPAIAYANDLWQDFFSERVGCQLQHPVYGIDLAVLCVHSG